MRKHYGSTAIILYVGEIIITGDSIEEIYKVKGYFSKVFKIKDLGPINYSQSIEISRSHKKVAILHRKYVLDLLNEQGHLDVNQLILLMEVNHGLCSTEGELLADTRQYQRRVRRLISDLSYYL